MRTALIGYTGFVGGTLLRQRPFDEKYNSSNIKAIEGQEFDLLVCAGAPAAKWIANQHPEEDLRNIEGLMGHLKSVSALRIVLISTVDVYRRPIDVDESTPIDPEQTDPYGRHRFYLEQFVEATFREHHILRLPGLFGEGLKKNFIYDLLNDNALDWTHRDSMFQWYDMSTLWRDIQVVCSAGLTLVNFATEPVRCEEVAEKCFQMKFDNITEKPAVSYDMHTSYSSAFGGQGDYIMSSGQVLNRISSFVQQERNRKLV